MSKFVIKGGNSLNGEVSIGGAKNAALKMMAAAILTDDTLYLSNVPDIVDIHKMKDILIDLGAKVDFSDHEMSINCSGINKSKLNFKLVKHLRGSVVTIGPLVAKHHQAVIPQPGGCFLGVRPIDTHLNAFRQLGIKVDEEKDHFIFEANNLKGRNVILDEMSVTATENILMAAVLAEGKSEIRLAASEPEIVDLADMLNKMGAKITGAGTSIIKVEGVKKLKGTRHTVLPDRIEAGTLAIAIAVTRGKATINNINPAHMEFILNKFRKANINFEIKNEKSIQINPTTMFNPIDIDTRPHPGFPTDLQAPVSVLLTQANGTSKIFETMYDGRLGYAKELEKMGADIKKVDVHTIIINGPTPLYGKKITSFDIRAGATLIIASLIAEGESTIDKIELVDRGYENLEKRLGQMGADIKRIS